MPERRLSNLSSSIPDRVGDRLFLIEDPGSLFCFSSVRTKDTGFPIKDVGDGSKVFCFFHPPSPYPLPEGEGSKGYFRINYGCGLNCNRSCKPDETDTVPSAPTMMPSTSGRRSINAMPLSGPMTKMPVSRPSASTPVEATMVTL